MEEIRVRRAVKVSGRGERRKEDGGGRCSKRRSENMRLWKHGGMGKSDEGKVKMKKE